MSCVCMQKLTVNEGSEILVVNCWADLVGERRGFGRNPVGRVSQKSPYTDSASKC